jgi:hypothetical protein
MIDWVPTDLADRSNQGLTDAQALPVISILV